MDGVIFEVFKVKIVNPVLARVLKEFVRDNQEKFVDEFLVEIENYIHGDTIEFGAEAWENYEMTEAGCFDFNCDPEDLNSVSHYLFDYFIYKYDEIDCLKEGFDLDFGFLESFMKKSYTNPDPKVDSVNENYVEAHWSCLTVECPIPDWNFVEDSAYSEEKQEFHAQILEEFGDGVLTDDEIEEKVIEQLDGWSVGLNYYREFHFDYEDGAISHSLSAEITL